MGDSRKVKGIRFTDREWSAISEKAVKCGYSSTSTFIRDQVIKIIQQDNGETKRSNRLSDDDLRDIADVIMDEFIQSETYRKLFGSSIHTYALIKNLTKKMDQKIAHDSYQEAQDHIDTIYPPEESI